MTNMVVNSLFKNKAKKIGEGMVSFKEFFSLLRLSCSVCVCDCVLVGVCVCECVCECVWVIADGSCKRVRVCYMRSAHISCAWRAC